MKVYTVECKTQIRVEAESIEDAYEKAKEEILLAVIIYEVGRIPEGE